MKYLCLVFSIFFTQISQAQLDKILKNKDVVWAAEVTSDLVLDDANLAYDSSVNYLYTLKYTPFKFNQVSNDDRDYLIDRYKECIKSKNENLIKNTNSTANSQFTLPIEGAYIIDPLNPNNIPEIIAIKQWRLRQIVYFNAKTSKWFATSMTVTPISITNQIKKENNYFLKIIDKKPRINAKNITWAKRSATRLLGQNHLFLDSVKVLKNVADPMALFFKDFESNFKNDYCDDGSLIDKNKLTPSVRRGILRQVDTIQVIDPTSMEESLKAVYSDNKPEDIRNLRLVHDWFWDNKKKRLYVRLVGVAPMKSEYGEEGFLYERPLFYQKYD